MFTLVSNADIQGTSLIGYIKLAPGHIMRAFGDPSPGDMYKVTGEYAFRGPDGAIFTLYDWKYGHMVWGRQSLTPLDLNIGGNELAYRYLVDFREWLVKTTELAMR